MVGVIALLGVLLVVIGAEVVRTIVARLTRVEVERTAGLISHLGGTRGRRVAVLLAGPLGAYLTVVILAVWAAPGRLVPTARIEEVDSRSDAVGKLAPGDHVVAIDGQPVGAHAARQLREVVQRDPEHTLVLAVERAGARREVPVRARKLDEGPARLGVVFARDLVDDRGEAFSAGLRAPFAIAAAVLEVSRGRDQSEVGGPVRLVEELDTAVETPNPWPFLVLFAAYTFWLVIAFDLVRAIAVLAKRRR